MNKLNLFIQRSFIYNNGGCDNEKIFIKKNFKRNKKNL